METVCRVILAESRLKFEEQVLIPQVGRADFVLDNGTVIEADGFGFHSSYESFENDRRRDRVLQLMGQRVLRFTWKDVMERPMLVAREAAAAAGQEVPRHLESRLREIWSPTGLRMNAPVAV